MAKYIFVTGGVVSSLGKGITAASLGHLLKARGLKVGIQKLDPYLNIDPGKMNPAQHGEVFVTYDGGQTDLDIGHYERFLDTEFTSDVNCTSGKIYSKIINKDIRGEYQGATIQVVPHVTGEIKNTMKSVALDNDVVIVEIGGTVGDMESLSFLEAIRQFERELQVGNYLHIHCTLVPYLEAAGEVKTKPTQHSVKELTSLGLNPDIIVCRTGKDVELSDQNKRKIAMFCNLLSQECVIHNPDCESIYEVPLVLNAQGLDRIVCGMLGLELGKCELTAWKKMVELITSDLPTVNIAIVGKYTEVPDSYLSITEAIKHAALQNRHKAKITIISSEDLEVVGAKEMLKNYDGVIVPGGFGAKGTEGKILTAEYCRENLVPYLGMGYGMQMAIIEFARNVAKLPDASSQEINPRTNNPVIIKLENELDGENVIRLGNYKVALLDNTNAKRIYGFREISERHRNAYEFNNEYLDKFISLGLTVSGVNEERDFVEIIEYTDHPFFIATQFLPELKSRPNRPHPLFVNFIASAINNQKKPTFNA